MTPIYFLKKILSTYCSRNIDCALFCYRAFTSNLDHWTRDWTNHSRTWTRHRSLITHNLSDTVIPPWLPLAYSSSHVFFFWNHKGIPHIRISWEHGHCKINFERFGGNVNVDPRWSLIHNMMSWLNYEYFNWFIRIIKVLHD